MSMVDMHMAVVALWVTDNIFDILTGTPSALSNGTSAKLAAPPGPAEDATPVRFRRAGVRKRADPALGTR